MTSKARRAVSVCAVIAPPMMMPEMAMIAGPVNAAAWRAKMIVSTGTTPLARATAIHGHAVRAVTRPLAVPTATENMTIANSTDAQLRRRTTPMISATIASCATARTVATTTSRSIPTWPTRRGDDGEHQQRGQGDDQLPTERGRETSSACVERSTIGHDAPPRENYCAHRGRLAAAPASPQRRVGRPDRSATSAAPRAEVVPVTRTPTVRAPQRPNRGGRGGSPRRRAPARSRSGPRWRTRCCAG